MIHRDLKPVNIFLDLNDRVKIGDFGLATTHPFTKLSVTGNTNCTRDIVDCNKPGLGNASHSQESLTGKVGTALYVSPELGNNTQTRVKYTQKVDLYSLGIIFFEMCYRPLSTSMERVKVLGNLRTVSKIIYFLFSSQVQSTVDVTSKLSPLSVSSVSFNEFLSNSVSTTYVFFIPARLKTNNDNC